MTPLKILQVGLGPLGQKAVTYLLDRSCFQIVGALDVNPDFIGKDVAKVSGRAAPGLHTMPTPRTRHLFQNPQRQ